MNKYFMSIAQGTVQIAICAFASYKHHDSCHAFIMAILCVMLLNQIYYHNKSKDKEENDEN